MNPRYTRWTQEETELVAKLHAGGFTYKQIGKRTGRTEAAIQTYMKRNAREQ